jgi:hypothetical protein
MRLLHVADAVLGVLAGIAWDPQIRGVLAVAAGVVILMGSIYLLLVTNLAHRLGFLIALAGFFGWMTIMGSIWWIRGIGMTGEAPSWEVEEINTGDLQAAILDEARDLDTAQLPAPEVINDATPEEFDEIADQVEPDLAGWTLLSAADPSRGEAEATVDEVLINAYPAFETSNDYVTQYAFETGGKPERQGDGVFERVANKMTNTLRITHPPHYAIVQVQPAIPQEAEPGQPPPTPEPNPDADVVSVVMVRDLGDLRFPPAMITLGSFLIFGLVCYVLHVRDRHVAEHQSALLPAPTTTSVEATSG